MKSKKEKLSFNNLITIILAAATVICLAAFAGIVVYSQISSKAKAEALAAAVENSIAVCKENAEKVEVNVDLLGNIEVYEGNINAQDSVLKKAYIALAMTTYVIDTINLNDPKTNYELSVELGSPKYIDGQLQSYEDYSYAVYMAQEELLAAQDEYLTIPKNNPNEPGIIEY